MSCKAAIYTVNADAATYTPTADGLTIPFGSTMRRFGNSGCQPILSCDGTRITASANGYYDVSVSATIATPTAGLVTMQLYVDGLPVEGATASVQTAADTQAVNLSFSALLRKTCCADNSKLSIVATGVPFILYNMPTVVEKV